MGLARNDHIAAWYKDQLQQEHAQRADAGIVMGLPIWGYAYIDRFLKYELPSILAPANRAALDAYRWELVVYGDLAACEMIFAEAPPYLPISIRPLPERVLREVIDNPGYKYTLLTAVHNLLIAQAAKKGAGWSMGAADVVYSERYFERLLALGQTHGAIAHQAPIVSQKAIGHWLDLAHENGALSLPANILGTLGWRYASGLMRSWLMDGTESQHSMPSSHWLVWRGKDYIRMHVPHLSPVWLSNARCRAAKFDLANTLDGISIGDCYIPTLADDMTLLTLDDSRDDPAGRVSFADFKRDLLPFGLEQFKRPVMVPTLPTDVGWLPDEMIEWRFQKLVRMLEGA